MIDWNIQSRSHECQACQKPFVDKQPYHTVLTDARHDYQRQDVCEPCWTAQFSHGSTERKGFISHWQGIYEAPPAAPPDAIQKETAETLLRKLMEQNNPQYRAASYILAVMLERKRMLKIKSQSNENGLRVFIYEQPKTGDIFTIPDPNLQLNQLDEVQRQVGSLLEHGLNPPPPAPTPAVEALEAPSAPQSASKAASV